MENNRLKKIFFVGVTDKEGTNNRKYSNLVYSVCKTIMINNTDITSLFDISSFLRHDMIPASNLYESIYHCFVTYDAFVVLIDDNLGKYNPNVWFELGIISTLDKPVLLIGKKNTVIPFHANELNVIGFPDEVLGLLKDKDISNYCGRNESIPNLIEHLKKNPLLFKELSTTFLDRMKYLLKHGSPFNYIINGAQIRDFGYSNLTRLFKESGIIRLIQNPDVHAEYIAGEKNAFDELTIEVNNAVESIRTTRFGDQSIVIRRPDEYKEITTAHDNFMNALYKAESRVSKFDRIICNNNPYKWYDITEVLKQPSKNVNVYIRKYNYNINFELVVIDEYARTLSEVKEKMAEVYSIKQNSNVSAIKLTVQIAAQQWLSSAKLRVKESSYANYENIISKHILPILGGEFMLNLTTSKLNDFIHHKLNNGRLNGKGGLSAKSVRDIMTVYRSIESYAVREYGIKETHFTMPKTEKKQTDVLNAFERKRLESYLMHNQNNTNISVLLCLFTGIRVGELCGLKWSNIDFENGTVQRINKHGKSEIAIGSPKSKSSVRIVPVPDFLLAILKTKRKGDDFFIITGTSKPTEPRTMQNRFKSILKVCGIRNVNFHLLRHTYATICIENGFDPKTLSELLGHADASITLNRYVHSSMQMKKKYVSRLRLTA
ncbi:MAG: site-specific integrase [Ruminococcus sp.]|nr:site-specific integrase [Ruminococcus sp.]